MTSPSPSTPPATGGTSCCPGAAEPGPKATMTELGCTPGQTVGPFFGMALPYPGGSTLVDEAHPDAIRLHGAVYDGAGRGVPDALVELWQPDSAGQIARQAGSLRRGGSGFTGWGRAATDTD